VIAVDVQESESVAKGFASENGWQFPVALDPNGDAARAYGVSGIPVTFVLDRAGNVVDSLLGAQDEQTLIGALDKAAK
jgi:peroxiredoxin